MPGRRRRRNAVWFEDCLTAIGVIQRRRHGAIDYDWNLLQNLISRAELESENLNNFKSFINCAITFMRRVECQHDLLCDLAMLTYLSSSCLLFEDLQRFRRWMCLKPFEKTVDQTNSFKEIFLEPRGEGSAYVSAADFARLAVTTGHVDFLTFWIKVGGSLWSPKGFIFEEEWKIIVECFLSIATHAANTVWNSNLIIPTRAEFEERPRLCTLFRAAEVFQQILYHPHNSEFSKCFRMMFDCIRDPIVTKMEITDLFQHTLRIGLSQEGIQNLIAEYVLHFPECDRSLAPRSLKHLSRCQIRESMSAARRLPDGVAALDIPEELKSYILCQNIPHPNSNVSINEFAS